VRRNAGGDLNLQTRCVGSESSAGPSENCISAKRNKVGACCIVVVEALCYKPECRGSEADGVFFLNLPNPSGRTEPCGLLSLKQK
jgi:hypothetical protein